MKEEYRQFTGNICFESSRAPQGPPVDRESDYVSNNGCRCPKPCHYSIHTSYLTIVIEAKLINTVLSHLSRIAREFHVNTPQLDLDSPMIYPVPISVCTQPGSRVNALSDLSSSEYHTR
jgi:hypothetical protein